jgi:hypothetical protein
MPALNGKNAVAWLIRHVQCVCGAKHRWTTECREFNYSALDERVLQIYDISECSADGN